MGSVVAVVVVRRSLFVRLSLLLSLPLSLPVVSPLPLSLPFDFRSLDTHRLCHSRRGNRFYAGKVRHPVHLFQDLGLYSIIRDPGTAKNQHISCMGSNLCSLSGSISEAAASANGRSPLPLTSVSGAGSADGPPLPLATASIRPVARPTAQRSASDNIQRHVRAWPRAS